MNVFKDQLIDNMNEEKKPERYFALITADHWLAKNKIAEAAKDLAMKMERQIIPESQVEMFKADFRNAVDALNEEYYRCKPLCLNIWNDFDDGQDIHFSIPSVFNLTLHWSKNK